MLELQEKMNIYLDNLFMNSTTKTPDQIVETVLQSDDYRRLVQIHPEIDSLIENWREKSKDYTYQTKIDLLTKTYSRKLEKFSKEAIDNAISFLHQRRKNHGESINDVELSDEAKEVFELMREFGESIKKIFIDNNIDITHITSISPERLEGGKLRRSLNRANNYETEVVDGVFASSSPVDGNNPYIARNSSGMIRAGKDTYIYGSDNIDVTQDSSSKKHAVLKQPNYVYYINPSGFTPVCNLTRNSKNEPVFEFSEEWISDTEIDISDPSQVRKVDEVKDVTSLLEHYTILCDVQSQGIARQAMQLGTREKAIRFMIERTKDGNVRNINREVGINVRDIEGVER